MSSHCLVELGNGDMFMAGGEVWVKTWLIIQGWQNDRPKVAWTPADRASQKVGITQPRVLFFAQPYIIWPQCVFSFLQMKSWHWQIRGGENPTSKAYLLGMGETQWTEVARMSEARLGPSCGVVKNWETDKEEVVAAAGWKRWVQ